MEVKIGSHKVNITSPDRILFPSAGYTKTDLLNYYMDIAPLFLPKIKNRILTLRRYPKGITQEGFYQKDAPEYYPSFIKRVNLKRKDGTTIHYMLCNNKESLAYLVNQSCIVYHVWLSKYPKLKKPDRMIFDLDPSIDDFSQIRWAAKKIRDLLQDDLGLKPYAMTTGSRGIHVVVPIKPEESFDFVKDFAQDLSRILIDRYPEKFTMQIRKEKRGKRIFLDTLRINYGQTGVAPFSVRAKKGAPVATPVEWYELTSALTPTKYTIKTIFKRLARIEDPWKDIDKNLCSLKKARKILNEMMEE